MHLMSRNVSLVVLVILGVVWGMNFLFMKLAVSMVPPLAVAGLRTMFGALPILTYALTRAPWLHLTGAPYITSQPLRCWPMLAPMFAS